MTWGEFKESVERQGVKDDMNIESINVHPTNATAGLEVNLEPDNSFWVVESWGE